MRTFFLAAAWTIAAPVFGQLPVEVDWSGKPVKRLPDGTVAPKSIPIQIGKDGKVRAKPMEEPKLSPADQFEADVERIIGKASESAADRHEAADVRTLSWLLRDYRRAVAEGDTKKAGELRAKMDASLQRSNDVAVDGPRRAAEAKRAEEERRHKEELAQRERQHQEALRQQEKQWNDYVNSVEYYRRLQLQRAQQRRR